VVTFLGSYNSVGAPLAGSPMKLSNGSTRGLMHASLTSAVLTTPSKPLVNVLLTEDPHDFDRAFHDTIKAHPYRATLSGAIFELRQINAIILA